MATKKHVKELWVRRTDAVNPETMYLCTDCITSVEDFVKILKRRRFDTGCDRCGWSNGRAEQDARLGGRS